MNNHSIFWLDENSHCLDNIRPNKKESKDQNTNVKIGAVARRFIKKGQSVISAPIFVIPQGRRVWENQPLLSHCFGNEESDALLCLSSFATLISHKPSSVSGKATLNSCNVDKNDGTCENGAVANTRYEWSAWNRVNKRYLGHSISDLGKVSCIWCSAEVLQQETVYESPELTPCTFVPYRLSGLGVYYWNNARLHCYTRYLS